MGALLRTLGLFEVDAQGAVTTWRAFFWPQGGAAAIYLHAQASAEDRRKVDDAIALLQSNPGYGVGRVFRGAELTARGASRRLRGAGRLARLHASAGASTPPSWWADERAAPTATTPAGPRCGPPS